MIIIINLIVYFNILFFLFQILIFESFIHKIIIVYGFFIYINLSIGKVMIFMIIIHILITNIVCIINLKKVIFIVKAAYLYSQIFTQVDSLYVLCVSYLFYSY